MSFNLLHVRSMMVACVFCCSSCCLLSLAWDFVASSRCSLGTSRHRIVVLIRGLDRID